MNNSGDAAWNAGGFSFRLGGGTRLQLGKLAIIACFSTIQTALLIFWTRAGAYQTSASVPAAALCLVVAFALAPLSWLEHTYWPRPSTLINIYLLVSLAGDAVQLRTLWLKIGDGGAGAIIAALATAALVIKTGLLALEVVEKRFFLGPEWSLKSPEMTAGIYSRALLAWVYGILATGASMLLAPVDLAPLSNSLETRRLSESFRLAWDNTRNVAAQSCATESGDGDANLTLALLKTLRWSLVAPVLPRLVQTAFIICQPLLLRELLYYLDGHVTFVGRSGYGFIITYGVVFLGLAVSSCVYWRLSYKCLVQLCGCIVSAVY
ncbi:ATP-binding cassette subfamily C (CFTR/MRP) member 1 [Microdochium nivale]|nr:ATP-binding cassette subfamily C (CFTR/MRP) member 1 [Microdochium nivale]